jgi:uncharacterized protein YdhG (YjbR/CyaY superfamily)
MEKVKKLKNSVDQDAAEKADAGLQAVEEYLAAVPEPARSTLDKVRATIRSVVPAETTEAIGYGIPTFRYKGGGLVAYAAFKSHCSFFPMSMAVIAANQNDLQKYDTSKGTIRFTVEKPLSVVLLKRMVKARLAEKDRNRAM